MVVVKVDVQGQQRAISYDERSPVAGLCHVMPRASVKGRCALIVRLYHTPDPYRAQRAILVMTTTEEIPLFLQRIHSTRTTSPVVPPRNATAPLPIYLPPPALPTVEEDLIPPENFAVVSSGVYRSGFPLRKNFPFMETLRLKTIL